MKYYLVENFGIENPSIDEATLTEIMNQHFVYQREAVDEGFVLFAGPKVGASGGCMIIKADSYEEVFEYVSGDPLNIAKLREYNINEFKPRSYQDFLETWFD